MRNIRMLAAVVFSLAVAFGLSSSTEAGFNCQGPTCQGKWGNTIYTTCEFDAMGSCGNAAETCDQYCDDKGGVHYIECDDGAGLCECNDPYICPICPWTEDDCEQPERFDYFTCTCQSSPLIADLAGNDISLTSPGQGITFDLNGDGRVEQIAWTAAGTDDGFLALDRNGDGLISNGTELFGTATAQPQGDDPNGFLALSVFDRRVNGGNGDGVIDRRDEVFARLVMWVDVNHNGLSEAAELKPLVAAGVHRISVDYVDSGRLDQYGNSFRFKARIWDNIDRTRWIWDVFLGVAPRT